MTILGIAQLVEEHVDRSGIGAARWSYPHDISYLALAVSADRHRQMMGKSKYVSG
jgi:hypothetical protein